MLVGSAVVSASFVVKAVDPTSVVPYNGGFASILKIINVLSINLLFVPLCVSSFLKGVYLLMVIEI